MQSISCGPRVWLKLCLAGAVRRSCAAPCAARFKSDQAGRRDETTDTPQQPDPKSYFYPNTSVGIQERSIKPEERKNVEPLQTPYPPFPDGKNPKTGEAGGPTGPEPTRFGDWERKGRVTDF